MHSLLVRVPAMVLLTYLALGCSGDDGTLAGAADSDLDSVTGIVTLIEDHVPVDGGVTLELELDTGKMDTAYLPSFFTAPPPPQEQYELYQIIQQLKLGDRIRVEGERTPQGVKIEKLTVVNKK